MRTRAKGSANSAVFAYKPGSLFEEHFPLWDMYSKEEEVVAQWKWITTVRYKTGDYVPAFGAYPVSITEHANTGKPVTLTRIYVPSRYRPMLRLLNFKQAWHSFCLTMPAPKKLKKSNQGEVLHQERQHRYEVWIDGNKRNIIYCDSIRNEFFRWIEGRYYGGSDAKGIKPRVNTMDDNQSCHLIENWLVHEILIQSHVPSRINLWMPLRSNAKRLKRLRSVFELGVADFVTLMSLT